MLEFRNMTFSFLKISQLAGRHAGSRLNKKILIIPYFGNVGKKASVY
jgi:hypothetical protein